jgi:hypothetical protein
VLHVDCLTPDFDILLRIRANDSASRTENKISGWIAELSRPIVKLTAADNDPELRVTAGWTASDEISLSRPASFFRRAIGRWIR